jgi:hypothetical protein
MTRRGAAGGGGGDGVGDRGTTVPLIVLLVLLAGTLCTAVTAASAAFLAQRDLAGLCDGAAVAAAATGRVGDGGIGLDPAAVTAGLERYRTEVAADPSLVLHAGTDGRTVTVRCHRTVRIPFGAVLGAPDGLDRTAVARARPVLRPAAPGTRTPATSAIPLSTAYGRGTVHLSQTQWTVTAWRWRDGADHGSVEVWPPLSTRPPPLSSACCTRVR